VGEGLRRVPAHRPGRSGSTVGHAEVESQHELRQTEQSSKVRQCKSTNSINLLAKLIR
jgi:hypothetical protein